jgi:hypothetical protein
MALRDLQAKAQIVRMQTAAAAAAAAAQRQVCVQMHVLLTTCKSPRCFCVVCCKRQLTNCTGHTAYQVLPGLSCDT